MRRDILILSATARRLLLAKDGRGRRWPNADCTAALVEAGTPAGLAQDCTDALGRVVAAVQAKAAMWQKR